MKLSLEQKFGLALFDGGAAAWQTATVGGMKRDLLEDATVRRVFDAAASMSGDWGGEQLLNALTGADAALVKGWSASKSWENRPGIDVVVRELRNRPAKGHRAAQDATDEAGSGVVPPDPADAPTEASGDPTEALEGDEPSSALPTPQERLALSIMRGGSPAYRTALCAGVVPDGTTQVLRKVLEAAQQLETRLPGHWGAPDIFDAVDGNGNMVLDALSKRAVTCAEEFIYAVEANARLVVRDLQERRFHNALRELQVAHAAGKNPTVALNRLVSSALGRNVGVHATFMGAGEILDSTEPDKTFFLYPILAQGETTALTAVGGTGKSAIVTFFLVCIYAGKSIGPLKVPEEPPRGKWLIVGGNENDLTRYRKDLRLALAMYPEAEAAVRSSLRFHVQRPGDTPLDGENLFLVEDEIRRLASTDDGLAGVVIDPISDFRRNDEDLNSDADMKALARRLSDVVHRPAPDAAVLLLHHARGGRDNLLSALDVYDAGEAGRNSKMLGNTCRCVLNAVPRYVAKDKRGVVFAVGKMNDEWPFEPFSLVRPRDGWFSLDESFNLDAFKAELSEKQPGKAKKSKTAKDDGYADAQDDTASGEAELLSCLAEGEQVTASELVQRYRERTGQSERTAFRRMDAATKNGALRTDGKTYCLP